MMLSFIIPAWNEQELIGRTIESIHAAAKQLDYPYEIVVADDASDDQTAAIATSLGARVVSCNNRQIAATRNAGAHASTGEYLVFVDADTFVPKEVVRETMEVFTSGVVAGGSFIVFDGKIAIHMRVFLYLFKIFYKVFGFASGAYLFCTREAFDAVGGFDETYFAAEEAVMSRSLHAHGRFHVLQSHVITSGRKLRTYSSFEMLIVLLKLCLPWQLRKRQDLWYGERRTEVNNSDKDSKEQST